MSSNLSIYSSDTSKDQVAFQKVELIKKLLSLSWVIGIVTWCLCPPALTIVYSTSLRMTRVSFSNVNMRIFVKIKCVFLYYSKDKTG